MDRDSRSSESRDRALSSEPSSTRPNPFAEEDAARKRRRTSPSPSRSSSVDTLPSQHESAARDSLCDMNVDTPEPEPPSTPARAAPPTEPVSSRVTLNLRNADSHEATPASPTSPTPAQTLPDASQDTTKDAEARTGQHPVIELGSSSPSDLDSPEPDGSFPAPDEFASLPATENSKAIHLDDVLLHFPYHADGETLNETVRRVINYFQSQPPDVTDTLYLIRDWQTRVLTYVDLELYSLVIDKVYQENRSFWQMYPDLIHHVAHRFSYAKSKESRDLILEVLAQFAELSSFFLSIDLRTLSLVAEAEDIELDLICLPLLRVLALLIAQNPSQEYAPPNLPDLQVSLECFLSRKWGPLQRIISFAELHQAFLQRFPKRVMENLSTASTLLQSIARRSHQKSTISLGSASVSPEHAEIMSLGRKFFAIVSDALDAVIDKSINSLHQECGTLLCSSLGELLRLGLQDQNTETIDLIQKHCHEHPQVSAQFVPSALALEWKFQVWCKLITSTQMQLRVSAVTQMCEELVSQWRRYQESPEYGEESNPYLDYLRFLARYIISTGIVDYILGPTCHPEITQGSYNIIGFLGVTRTYTAGQTDLFWQTFTSTQDPRVSDALMRMMTKMLHLVQPDHFSYLLDKFNGVPVDDFTPVMRELFDTVLKQFTQPRHIQHPPFAAYEVCVRLLRESSVFNAHNAIAYPDIQHFAFLKFQDLLAIGPSQSGRDEIALGCLQDIADKSPTTSGSLQVLGILMASHHALSTLVSKHNLTRLLVDELEAAIMSAKSVGYAPVYASSMSAARRKFISGIIQQHGETISSDLGQRLWDLLVGPDSLCHEDRRVAWDDLVLALRRCRLGNPFLAACLREYLPKLPPSYYCAGCLTFVRDAFLPLVNDTGNDVMLDIEESVELSGLELLWRMILDAPDGTIEDGAIYTLVSEIYVDSRCINGYPVHRARKVHFGLVQRCLRQLKFAAQRLQAFSDGTTSGDDEPMVIVATDDQLLEQERHFTRTLKVLNSLLKAMQMKPHFAAPDLRSLMLPSPSEVDGEPADLKIQSFDGDKQSDVRRLVVGLKNTVASLLSTIRDATGFEHYRIYYRGVHLTPSESTISKTLGELGMTNGLMLIKNDPDMNSSPVRIKPGASPLDIEILSHFKDLWEYLTMEEKFSKEIYKFLISLPADDSILAMFEDPKTSTRMLFPLGQPFKSLYALHALRESLRTWRIKDDVLQSTTQQKDGLEGPAQGQGDALIRAISLVATALCDDDIIARCSNNSMQILLSFHLVDNFVQLLKEIDEPSSIERLVHTQLTAPVLYRRLLSLLKTATAVETTTFSVDLVLRCFEGMMESCNKSHEFWVFFRSQVDEIQSVLRELLLYDERPYIRKGAAKVILIYTSYDGGPLSRRALEVAQFFWPILLDLVPQAADEQAKCEEVFSITYELLTILLSESPDVVDLNSCVTRCGSLLLSHRTIEDIANPDDIDVVALGLLKILNHGVKQLCSGNGKAQLPVEFAQNLFTQHLFPVEDENGPLAPRVILTKLSRYLLYDTLSHLMRVDRSLHLTILRELHRLTSLRELPDGSETYKYELPQQFDRTNAMRSSSGYAGLRNLSNTCYLNSLFTQLFMNVRFRRFILNARVPDNDSYQLIWETQRLFAQLQDSRRRFVDPQACVEQITTYDESPIDIHNQMDVDEFYSLLFDRWEAQLPSEVEKRALRSIYGGQLVQQVKSKECEHISERIEPFSAIQCDIKGKSSLQESLQAYVDGEIMEGENKYKCSTCDRHVDAVKRACLKDIPDNLIFHLKRFDFNLRTLTRNKINDYFPFPTKIDMQPYTIEHLSHASSDAEPDIFELVGVLVHSGTAESGHYYSFIRERPSTHEQPSWVEFNDDIVTTWDPSHMEGSCFGGPDYRPQYDSAYEKVYSAYMLFYQRSSTLKKEQDALRTAGDMQLLRADLPRDLELEIKSENWATVQRHCLYDPSHIAFVCRTLGRVWGTKCSDDHKEENLAMQIALGHMDQVVSRNKDLVEFRRIINLIEQACQQCALCSFAFFDFFRKHREVFRMLLLRNTDHTVRIEVGQLFSYALRKIKTTFPDEYGITLDKDGMLLPPPSGEKSVLESAVDLFLYVFETFHQRPQAWLEYFGAIIDFIDIGHAEPAMLLEKDFLYNLILIIAADQSFDIPMQYSRMLTIIGRRMGTRPVAYENVITLIDLLMSATCGHALNILEEPTGRLELALRNLPVPYTAREINLLHQEWPRTQASVFVDRLIQINQNPDLTEAIIERLIEFGPLMDQRIYNALRVGITGQAVTHAVAPYLQVAVNYVQLSRDQASVSRLIDHVNDQCRALQNVEGKAFFDFHDQIFEGERHTDSDPNSVRATSLGNIPMWAPGLLGYMDHAVSREVERFLNAKVFQYGVDPQFPSIDDGASLAQVLKTTARLLAINCLHWLRETYIAQRLQVTRETVMPIIRTIKSCEGYFDGNEAMDDGLGDEYRTNRGNAPLAVAAVA
ncbi:ubiquitin carboxyl-terminal hydrolase [Xylariomycetidae sp. FL0641]|nr:ubiquitin carboxyl-terminal hydrolase [Xylariomycetidae sp. FL0641]